MWNWKKFNYRITLPIIHVFKQKSITRVYFELFKITLMYNFHLTNIGQNRVLVSLLIMWLLIFIRLLKSIIIILFYVMLIDIISSHYFNSFLLITLQFLSRVRKIARKYEKNDREKPFHKWKEWNDIRKNNIHYFYCLSFFTEIQWNFSILLWK